MSKILPTRMHKKEDPRQRLKAALCRSGPSTPPFEHEKSLGPAVADFVCVQKKLVVEVDRALHLDSEERQRARDAIFARHGFRVRRFRRWQVHQHLGWVLSEIEHALKRTNDDEPESQKAA
jgi:very-short-patch-repair endonuclease